MSSAVCRVSCWYDNWQVVSSQLFIWTRAALCSHLLTAQSQSPSSIYTGSAQTGRQLIERRQEETCFISSAQSSHLISLHGNKDFSYYQYHVRSEGGREILLPAEDSIVIPGRSPHVAAVFNFRVSCQLFLSCQSSDDDGDRKEI